MRCKHIYKEYYKISKLYCVLNRQIMKTAKNALTAHTFFIIINSIMPELLQKLEQSKKEDTTWPHKIKKRKSSLLSKSLVILAVVIVLIGFGFATKVILAVNSTDASSGEKIGFFEQIKNLISNPEKQIIGEVADRINILLMGIGGSGHQGAYLADTIIIASIKPSTGEVAMMSIPRDLVVEIPDYGWRKINNALAFGQQDDYPGGGEALMASIVSSITSLPIHYYARIDFSGFRKVVDDLGGIDVYIDNAFTDYQYPDYSFGYQTISFKQGWELMSGERALQFVRSRHGNSGEGSDFARSQRQQKVLLAFKQKALSFSSLFNPTGIISALDDLGDHNKTDMQVWEILEIAKLVKNVEQNQIITQVLDNDKDGLLQSRTTEEGAYILEPKAGDFSEIQRIAKNIFQTNPMNKENARIAVQNGTDEEGLAKRISKQLTELDYRIVEISNAPTQDYKKTIIYDLSGGKKPSTITGLKSLLDAHVTSSLPVYLTSVDVDYDSLAEIDINNLNKNINGTAALQDIDILIILGEDKAINTQISTANHLTKLTH